MNTVNARLIGSPEALEAILEALERAGVIVHRRSRRKAERAGEFKQFVLIEVEADSAPVEDG